MILAETAEIILGAEVEIDANALVGEMLHVNVASIGAAFAGENDQVNPVTIRLYGSATTGGGLTLLATENIGPISGLDNPKGPLCNMVLPALAKDYPFLKCFGVNMDAADDIDAGELYAWLGGAPQAGHPVK
jgi:hypothetical protein